MDNVSHTYRRERIDHWNRVSGHKDNPKRMGRFYQQLLEKYYRFFIPPGLTVLELGCGHGDLLASLSPSLGVGIDFSDQMIQKARQKHPELHFIQADIHEMPVDEKFDVIILSDLVNDLWDVQAVMENIRRLSHPGTRVVINYYNNLWKLPLSFIKWRGLGADLLDQNWFSPHDVVNLLQLAGFEVVRTRNTILFPLKIPYLSSFLNRFLVNFPLLRWFALANFIIARPIPETATNGSSEAPSVSVVIPARNESGNVENIFNRISDVGFKAEWIFVEGNSSDDTYDAIQNAITRYPDIDCKLFRQTGKGKGDAVRLAFEKAEKDILMILDADLTVPPEDLYRFYDAIVSGKGEFINGVRLVYPMEDAAMRFFNILGNKFFSLAFTWLMEQPIKDTLCGTKVIWKKDYDILAANRHYFGDFDPFGDFDLLFGASKLNLKITEIPIRYRSRIYGDTNISRWRHGWLLLKMVVFAALRIKFI